MTLLLAALLSPQAAEPDARLDSLHALDAHRAHRVAEAPTISDAEYARVAAGEVISGVVQVPGYAARKVYGAAIVEGPIDRLWASVNSELQHLNWTSISYSELTDGQACASRREVFHYLEMPMAPDRWWITQLQINEGISSHSGGAVRELVWDSASDAAKVKTARAREIVAEITPLRFTRGSWLLMQLSPDETLVEYYAWIDPGGAVPTATVSSFAVRNVPENLANMARFASDGAPGCLGRLSTD